jgi:hypothetical protein
MWPQHPFYHGMLQLAAEACTRGFSDPQAPVQYMLKKPIRHSGVSVQLLAAGQPASRIHRPMP